MKAGRSLAMTIAVIASATSAFPSAAQDHEHHGAVATPARVCEEVGKSDRGCTIEEFLLSRLVHDGVETAMAALDSLAASDSDIRRDAHSYAHGIGLAAFADPETVGEVFSRCTPAYQSGCYHGVIQAYFVDHASTHGDHLDGELVNSLCLDQRGADASRWLLFQCAHGMGHGLFMLSGNHLPSALEWCDLVQDSWERESCYGGVFMENIVHVTSPHHTPDTEADAMADAGAEEHDHHAPPVMSITREEFPPLKREEPFYPCTAIDARYHVACYQMQTSAVLYYNRQDLEATVRLCGTIPQDVQAVCFQSLGRDISSITLQDHSRAMRLCAIAPTEYEPWCHIGYTKNLVDVTADPGDGFEYCRMLPAGESKRQCYIAVGEQIWVLTESTEQRASMCIPAEPAYSSACRHGAGLDDIALADVASPAGGLAYRE